MFPASHEACERKGLIALVTGVSDASVCGVRDHARLLAAAMRDARHAVHLAWAESIGELRTHRLEAVASSRVDALLLHYSVFAFSRRGVPLGVPALALRLHRLGLPVVLFAHEYAYPWGRRGWRGATLALTQRIALFALFWASAAVVVTTDDRRRWLESRIWLPRRPVTVAPVFSTISRRPSCTQPIAGRIGLFSFGAEGIERDLLMGAVSDIARRRPGTHLALIGHPGPDSDVGEQWRQAAEAIGCPVVFTGIADEAEISRHLTSCEVMVFADPAGPTSRRTALAAAMTHGRAVVALDGPQTWPRLAQEEAVALVPATREALGNALGRLLDQPTARTALKQNARAFAERHLSVTAAAHTVSAAIQAALDHKAGSPGHTTGPAR